MPPFGPFAYRPANIICLIYLFVFINISFESRNVNAYNGFLRFLSLFLDLNLELPFSTFYFILYVNKKTGGYL